MRVGVAPSAGRHVPGPGRNAATIAVTLIRAPGAPEITPPSAGAPSGRCPVPYTRWRKLQPRYTGTKSHGIGRREFKIKRLLGVLR